MKPKHVVISRRTVLGGALVALLPLPEQAIAGEKHARRSDLLVLLLKGLYTPVTRGPELGLSSVHLSDGSYSTTKIYPVIGLPGHPSEKVPIGDFYVQFDGMLCAYDLPGGAFAMEFTPVSDTAFVDDGHGGRSLDGTYELNILEATGQFRSLVGGHNHMVDKLHFLAPGDGSGGIDEYCFCFITRGRSKK
ncbi:MAG: hypothetical protein QOE87_1864 [Gaiellales bacterium]|jgi:hypothetical protein|nr:hypothetical protein [Gaiellales bacterium]